MKNNVSIACSQCGNRFEVNPSRAETAKFCSKKCYGAYRTGKPGTNGRQVAIVCIGCGKNFEVSPSQGARKWCSEKCRYSTPGWQNALFPNARRAATCLTCGKQFEVVSSKVGKYCSRKCVGVANGKRMKRDPNKWMKYTCQECGNSFDGLKSVSGRKRFCSTKCRTNWRNRMYRVSRPTSIETALKDALEARGVRVTSEYRFGRFNIDLAIPHLKIAIEADGSYWHSLPKQKKADKAKDSTLKAAGWQVFRFTESQINADADKCAQSVAKAISE